jgi:hypothetical protein
MFLFRSIRISTTRFIAGGRFVTPCFSERRKILEIIYSINYIMFVEFMSLHNFYFVLMYAFRFLFCD